MHPYMATRFAGADIQRKPTWHQRLHHVYKSSSDAKQSAGVIIHGVTYEGKVLFAEVKCVTDGSHICYYEINVTDDLGTEVALVTANGYRMTQ